MYWISQYTSVAEKQTQIFVHNLIMTFRLTSALQLRKNGQIQVIRAENFDISGRESYVECKNILPKNNI